MHTKKVLSLTCEIKFKINPEYSELVPKPSKEDSQFLLESIQKHGQQFPIILNSEYEIVDGHTRFEICQMLNLEPKYEIRQFASKLDEKQFVILSNLHRRHLNNFQKVEMLIPLFEIEQELAKQRQKSGTIASDQAKGKSSAKIAKFGKIGRNTLEQVKYIKENADDDLLDKLRSGKTKINFAYKTLKRQERKKNQSPLPLGIFSVLIADCPWRYDHNQQGSPENHYDTMPVEALCALASKIREKLAKNAVLFMWATAPKLKEALQVMEAWGFRYVTHMVWDKVKVGVGEHFRNQHELLLFGRMGNLPIPEPEDRPSSILRVPRTTHSKKPDEIYEIIEKMYPNQKYLELFARMPEQQHFSATAQQRRNWTYWGNEVE